MTADWRTTVDWWTDPRLAYAAGLADGRALGYQAGREGFAGEMLTAVRFALASYAGLDPTTVHDLLAAPLGDLMAAHLRDVERTTRRRRWDAEASEGRAA